MINVKVTSAPTLVPFELPAGRSNEHQGETSFPPAGPPVTIDLRPENAPVPLDEPIVRPPLLSDDEQAEGEQLQVRFAILEAQLMSLSHDELRRDTALATESYLAAPTREAF